MDASAPRPVESPAAKFSLRAGVIGGLAGLGLTLVIFLVHGSRSNPGPPGGPNPQPPARSAPAPMAPSKLTPLPVGDPAVLPGPARLVLGLVGDDLRSGRAGDAVALARSLGDGGRNAVLLGLVRVTLAATPPDQVEGELEKAWLEWSAALPTYAVAPPLDGRIYAPLQGPVRAPSAKAGAKKDGPPIDAATLRRALDVAAQIDAPGPRAEALIEIRGAMGTGRPAGDEADRRWRDVAMEVIRASDLMPVVPVYVEGPSPADRAVLVDELAELDLKLRRAGTSALDRRRRLSEAAEARYGELLAFLRSRSDNPPASTARSKSADRAEGQTLVAEALQESRSTYEREQAAETTSRSEFLKKGFDLLVPAVISGLGFVLSGMLTPALAGLARPGAPAADPHDKES